MLIVEIVIGIIISVLIILAIIEAVEDFPYDKDGVKNDSNFI